jgi:4-hydroxy-tetrahydrodipicolinate synthase
MGTARFGKVLTAMVTPFTAGGDLDLDGAAALARWLVAQGNDGLVVAGTTGEAPTLSDDEKVALWGAVRAAVDVPLLAGSGTNDTRHTVELSQRAAETGVDGLLVVSPYYNRPPQAGLDAHFRAVAAATDLPVVMYDVPTRTGRAMTVDTIMRLATEVPTIAGLKDARGNPGEAARIVAGAPHDFDVYSGDDALTLALLAVGAVGVVGVATHWSAGLHAEMIAAHGKGDVETAREINARLAPSFAVETGEGWVHTSAAKAALEALGQPAGPCRLPLPPLGDDVRGAVRRVLDDLGLTEPVSP